VFANIDYPRLKYYIGAAWRMLEKHITEASDSINVNGAWTEGNGTDTSYTKKKEIRIPCAGIWTVKFDLAQGYPGGSRIAYGRVYNNGVAVGTERQHTSGDYTTYSQDFLLAAGDLIQLYCKVSGSLSSYYEKNFTLYADFGSGNVTMDT
jgi:hypothetical protein